VKRRSLSWLSTLGMVVCGAAGVVTTERSASAGTIAVVGSLTGSALVSQGTSRKALMLFDWIPEGSEVTLPAGSSMTLVFADGRRFALAGKSRVRVAAVGPEMVAGTLQPLEAVPPLPHLDGIAPRAHPGGRSGALRVRGEGAHGLYPHAGVAALPDSTVLRFLLAEPGTVEVEVRDEDGQRVFQTETRADGVLVPEGVLASGAWYSWEVRESADRGSASLGEAEFFTLAREDVDRREVLKAKLESKGDAAALALLAAVDRQLGLLAEARAELAAALSKAPHDVDLSRALEDLDRELESSR
jgi:hypothetical protein